MIFPTSLSVGYEGIFCQLNCQDASSVCIEALPEGQTSVGWGRSKRCKAPRMVEIMGKDAKSFGDVFFRWILPRLLVQKWVFWCLWSLKTTSKKVLSPAALGEDNFWRHIATKHDRNSNNKKKKHLAAATSVSYLRTLHLPPVAVIA